MKKINPKFLLIVKPKNSKIWTNYGWYVNFSFQEVQKFGETLPRDWDYEIQRS